MSEKVAKTTESGLVYYDEPDPSKPPPEPEPLSHHQLEQGEKLLAAFLDMPVEAQLAAFSYLERAFMHRGSRGIGAIREKTYVELMADVFAANGHPWPEYT